MLVGIIGNLGSGKTLFCAFLLSLRKAEGFTIYSNFHNAYADVLECGELMLLHMDTLKQEKGVRYIFAIDELGQILAARDFMTSANKMLSVVFRRSRKRKCDVYYTSQSAMMVDPNVRRITDIVIETEYARRAQRVRAKIYGACSLWGATLDREKSIDATLFFDKFDTDEVIEVNRDAIFDELLKMLLNKPKLLRKLEIAKNRVHQLRLLNAYMGITQVYGTVLLDLFEEHNENIETLSDKDLLILEEQDT